MGMDVVPHDHQLEAQQSTEEKREKQRWKAASELETYPNAYLH